MRIVIDRERLLKLYRDDKISIGKLAELLDEPYIDVFKKYFEGYSE